MNKPLDCSTSGILDVATADGQVHAAERYARMPVEVLHNPDLSMGARVCYSELMSYALHTNKVWPGQQRIADNLHVSTRMIRNYIDELRLHGLLTISPRSGPRTNVYTLTVFVESTGFQAFDHAGNHLGDRKNTSASMRKNTSALPPEHRKNTSYKDDETQIYNDKTTTTSVNAREEKDRAKVLSHVEEAKRLKVLEKLDAYCAATGIQRAHMTRAKETEALKKLSETPMPTADIMPLVTYLKTNPFFGQHLDRLSPKVVADRWAGWMAAGRPENDAPKPSTSFQQRRDVQDAAASSEYHRMVQTIADQRGEVFKGVSPSYWSTPTASAHGLDYAGNGDNVGVRSDATEHVIEARGVVR